MRTFTSDDYEEMADSASAEWGSESLLCEALRHAASLARNQAAVCGGGDAITSDGQGEAK